MKGQISLEMLMVLLLVFAVIALVSITILRSAESTSEQIESRTNSTLDMLSGNLEKGESCSVSSECKSGICDSEMGVCK